MAIVTDWLPSRLAELLVMFQNVAAKIEGYKSILPITGQQVERITLICNEFVAVYNYVTQARATTESLVEWRTLIPKARPPATRHRLRPFIRHTRRSQAALSGY